MSKPKAEHKLTGWHVLGILCVFFGVMLAVNGVFLYNALTTFPGEDVKKSYMQGLNYNDTLAMREAQAQLGWSAAIGVEGANIVVHLADREGADVSQQLVTGQLRRETHDDGDQALAFRYVGNGDYVAEVGEVQQGRWLVTMSVEDPDDATRSIFNAERSLIIP